MHTFLILRYSFQNRRSWHEDGASQLSHSQLTLLRGGAVVVARPRRPASARDRRRGQRRGTALRLPHHSPFRSRNAPAGGSLHGIKPRDEVALLRRTGLRDTLPHRNSIAGDQVLIHHRGASGDLSGLGSVGSRRTVYLSEDDAVAAPPPIPVPAEAPDAAEEPPGEPHHQQQQNTPPLLVYNRV
ncbi:unnamed protein product [Callosobruchus maculatus]|uniref:Uncharacterized protein n=1 Tax=Callosobruchus maculatus TaxID=64391 RepID=A0A653CYZ2_CALMS|nr:unnamed protein product [Callosobruchus maculatus]